MADTDQGRLSGVKETLLYTLVFRAMDQRAKVPIVGDPWAAGVLDRVAAGNRKGVRTAKLGASGRFTPLLRAKRLDDWTEDFLGRHRGPVVPLADGLLEHDHGRRLLAVGRHVDGIRMLRSAKQRFARLGAIPFEQRVDEDLDNVIVPPAVVPAPRRPDVLAGLTDRESEVAHLVGRNMTNREIGAELYVTTKTVEYHLGNIYAKLGITSRRQLRDLLAERPHPDVPRDESGVP